MSLNTSRGFTLLINDTRNLKLEIAELTLPTFEEHKESFQAGGSDQEMEITGLGAKAITIGIKTKSHDPREIGLFAGDPSQRQRFTARKLVMDELADTPIEIEHAIDVTGRLTKITPEALKAGSAPGYDYEIGSITQYTEYWDGVVLARFNILSGGWEVRNGQAVNTAARRILG